MAEEFRRLPIWHSEGLQAVDMAPIREAKAALDLDFKVKPAPARIDIDERILAIGTRPPFLCDYALWSGKSGPAGLSVALSWVLGDHDDPRATTIVDTIQHFFPGARQMTQEELDSERAMFVYLNRIE